MKIVLIQPPIEDFYSTAVRLQPIGLAYLKAAVKKALPEVEIKIKDFLHGYGRRTIPLPGELRFLRPFYRHPDRSPFSTFYHYYCFGATVETIVQEVARENPDLVGISVLFTAYAPQALQVARVLKEKLDAPILLGGSHVSALPQKLLELPFVDFVIRGEGERAFVAMVEEWLGKKNWAKVPSLGFKAAHGKPVLNAWQENFNIDQLPFPDLSDFEPQTYTYQNQPMCFVISTRSCPYRCAFCSVHQTFGHGFRKRSAENILSELEMRFEQGYRVFDFEDDNLTVDASRFSFLCEEIAKRFSGKAVRFLAMNGISYFHLSPQLLEKMRAAGFEELNLSLVSTNRQLLRQLKRPFDLQGFEKVVQKAVELKMQVTTYQILGLPGETTDSMIGTLRYLTRLPVKIGASPFYLTPGMPLAMDNNTSWIQARLTSLGALANQSQRRTIYTLFVTTRLVNFLKQLPVEEKEIHFSELKRNEEAFSSRQRLGLQLIDRLLKERQLFAYSGKTFNPLPEFNVELFERFLQSTKFICTTAGKKILF